MTHAQVERAVTDATVAGVANCVERAILVADFRVSGVQRGALGQAVEVTYADLVGIKVIRATVVVTNVAGLDTTSAQWHGHAQHHVTAITVVQVS